MGYSFPIPNLEKEIIVYNRIRTHHAQPSAKRRKPRGVRIRHTAGL